MIKFRNGFIYSNGRYYKEMTVDGDKILSISDDELCLTEEVVDLGGSYVYPGFHDSHLHLENLGKTLYDIVLNDAKSIKKVIEISKEYLKNNNSDVVFGRGWNQDRFEENRMLNRKDLDLISEDVALVFVRACGHILVCNTKAIELVGLEGEIEGGVYDPNTGIYCETACDYVISKLSKKRTVEMEKIYIKKAMKQANEYGITSIGTNDIYDYKKEAVSKAYLELEKEGELSLFVFHQIGSKVSDFKEVKEIFKDSKLNICHSIKVFMDGSLGAKTAWLRNNYIGEDHNGVCAINLNELKQLIVEAKENNIPIVGHAIGDMAIITLARLFAEQDKNNSLRNGIIHVQITDEEILNIIKDNNLLTYTQPIFIDYDMHIVNQRVGELSKTSYAFKTLINKNVHQSFGTDCPVESLNPFNNLYCAVSRCDLSGKETYLKEEALTIKEAFDAYTIEGAYAVGYEDKLGKLDAGYYANFFVLEKDLFETSINEIKKLKPTATYVLGKKVY